MYTDTETIELSEEEEEAAREQAEADAFAAMVEAAEFRRAESQEARRPAPKDEYLDLL